MVDAKAAAALSRGTFEPDEVEDEEEDADEPLVAVVEALPDPVLAVPPAAAAIYGYTESNKPGGLDGWGGGASWSFPFTTDIMRRWVSIA